MASDISPAEFAAQLRSFRRTAFRLELQPSYAQPYEAASIAAFDAAQPQDPLQVREFAAWFEQVRALTREGRRMARVRVHEDPPTAYQRWERWLDSQLNTPAGEDIRYLTRPRAHEIGLLPAAGDVDWWLLDDERLITMTYDGDRRCSYALELDPEYLARARVWRDLAVRHGVSDAAAARGEHDHEPSGAR